MTALEALIRQQQQFEQSMTKNSTAIDAILEYQKNFNNFLPKGFADWGSQLAGLEKINSIRFVIPQQPAILNFNNFSLNSDILKVTQAFNWVGEFKQSSKLHSQFADLFNVEQDYRFIERDLASLYEDFNGSESENVENETPTSIIITETQRIKEIIRGIYLNDLKLFSIHPREFEKIIAELLYNQGFEVELTKQTRDNGYDIIALKYIDNFSPIKYLVECKRYSEKNKVGVEIIRSFKEVIATEQANKGIIVTTSYFTKDALKKQKETPYLLDYKNKDEVINWVNDYMHKTDYR